MSLVSVTQEKHGLTLDRDALAAALAALRPGAPVVAMVHGFRFQPGSPRFCPHADILSLRPTTGHPRAVSWPRHLGLAGSQAGLAVGFGWHAGGTIWAAQARAGKAAAGLAETIRVIREIDPTRPVDILAHSLGARVALSAFDHLQTGDLGRVVLMEAAEFRRTAERAMASPAGRAADVVNVTSHANRMFDFCMELLLSDGRDVPISQGLSKAHSGWTDLCIDRPGTEEALARFGLRLLGPGRRFCHWSPFLRPGMFRFYRALFERRLHPAALRTALAAAPMPPGRRLWPGLSMPGNPA